MERLISQGKITYVGSSNFPGWAIARANEKAIAKQQMGLISEQSVYNLIERRVELEVIPACREYGLGLIPWSPQAGGLLSRPSKGLDGRRQSEGVKNAGSERVFQLQQYYQFCAQLNESPSAIALAWLLHQPQISACIIGPASIEQLVSVLHVPDIRLSQQSLDKLDEIFPPTGEAPEAYAW